LKPGNVFLHCVPPFASDLAVAKVLDFESRSSAIRPIVLVSPRTGPCWGRRNT
jgi:hypothetical protein